MENPTPGKSKGYQKQVKKEAPPLAPKEPRAVDYSSPAAKKWPLFLEALEAGNVSGVRKLVEEGLNLNIMRDGATPLMLAASKGKTEIAEEIIQSGVNVNEKNDDGWTALHKAAFDQAGAGIVELLIQSGINIEAKTKTQKTALNLAEEKRHGDIVRAIRKHQQKLEADAQEWENFLNSAEGKPFKQQKRYDSLSFYARFWWLPPVVLGGSGLLFGFLLGKVLLAGIIGIVLALVADSAVYVLMMAIKKYLDEIGPLPDLDIHTLRLKRQSGEPILKKKEAASAAKISGVQSADPSLESPVSGSGPAEERFDWQASGSASGGYPAMAKYALFVFVFAILIGVIVFMNRESVSRWYYTKKLAGRGIQVSGQAFLDAVSKNDEEAVDLFLKAGEPGDRKNEQEQTALHIAVDKGYADLLAKLVKRYKPLMNHADASGNTPLMSAARQGNEPIVKLLLESDSDVNYLVPDREGAASALQAAMDAPDLKNEHLDVVQDLLQHGADVKARNASGRSALLFAAEHGRAEAAKLLLEKGADVNEADQKGIFPLYAAACRGHAELITLLAEKGANMKAALPGGQTPLMCASREGRMSAINVLVERGAAINAKTPEGIAALTEASRRGDLDAVKLLLEKGADPAAGYLPDSFIALNGKTIGIRARNNKISDLLKRIAVAASQDGYTINYGPVREQKTAITAQTAWNKVLNELARKTHLLLLVKDKAVFVLPYDPGAIKHEGN